MIPVDEYVSFTLRTADFLYIFIHTILRLYVLFFTYTIFYIFSISMQRLKENYAF